jgi:hypothetical protein
LGTPNEPALDLLALGKGYDRFFRFHETTLLAFAGMFKHHLGDRRCTSMAGNFA